MSKLDLQIRTWRKNDSGKQKLLFNDTDINLYAKLAFDNNSDIGKIDFDLQNVGSNTYSICKIIMCPVNNPEFGDFIAIHLSEKGGKPNGQSNPFPSTSSDFGALNLSKGKFATLLFIVSEDSCTEPYTCSLENLTPKTKKGAIIVGI